jgi:UDP-N-acetylglucosamine 1-carboxyvinyltransferase
MESFLIEGGQPLKGSITPQGAKNEALQILCAVLLTPETVNIKNIPDIVDVNKLIQLLKNFGVAVEKIDSGFYRFNAKDVNLGYLSSEQFKEDGKGLRG